MLGYTTVTVILPESTGMGTENWDTYLESTVSNEIVEGLTDLSLRYNGLAMLMPSWSLSYVLGRTDARA